jgi:hypothetical protein
MLRGRCCLELRGTSTGAGGTRRLISAAEDAALKGRRYADFGDAGVAVIDVSTGRSVCASRCSLGYLHPHGS